MSAKRGILAAFILLSIAIICSAQTVKQAFSLSRNLSDENTRFDIAVSSKTGNVMVAWERLTKIKGEWEIDGIYYVFAKRKSDGRYKVSSPKYLHEGEWIERDYVGDVIRDSYQFPDIEYNPVNNTFLTVYSSGALERTLARVVNEKGKIVGKEVWVWPDNTNPAYGQKDMTYARIVFIPGSKAPGQFRIFFRHDGRHISKSYKAKPTGMFTAIIDDKGNFLGPEPEEPVFEHLYGKPSPNSVRTIATEVNSVCYVKDGGMLVGFSKPYFDDSTSRGYSYRGWAAKLDKNGTVVKTTKVGDDNSGGAKCIAELKKGRYQFTWEGNWTREKCQGNNHVNTVFTHKLKQKGQSTAVIPGNICSSAWTVKLGANKGSFQVYKPSNQSAFFGYQLSPKGKVLSNNKLMEFDSFYGMLQAVAIPGTNNVFVAWLKSNDQGGLSQNEIHGFVVDALN